MDCIEPAIAILWRVNTSSPLLLQILMVFKREFSYYLLTIYVPSCMLVIVSWVSPILSLCLSKDIYIFTGILLVEIRFTYFYRSPSGWTVGQCLLELP